MRLLRQSYLRIRLISGRQIMAQRSAWIYKRARKIFFKRDAATYQNKLLYMQKCIITRQIITFDKYKATNIQENIYL